MGFYPMTPLCHAGVCGVVVLFLLYILKYDANMVERDQTPPYILYQQGLERVTELHPEVDLFIADIDESLNDKGYILSGLGDAGDKIFGTKQLVILFYILSGTSKAYSSVEVFS